MDASVFLLGFVVAYFIGKLAVNLFLPILVGLLVLYFLLQ